MKYIKPLFKATVGGLGLRFGSYWPYDYTGADHYIILALSVLVLITGLSELNNQLNS